MGHGHDYKLEVSLREKLDSETGMLISLEKVDTIVRSVLDILDHRHLNKEVEHFKNQISTGENIVVYLWHKLEARFPEEMLYHLKLWETNNNYFEYGKGILYNE